VKNGARGAFRAGAPCVKQLRCLPVLKIKKKKLNYYLQVAKAVDHILVVILKYWYEFQLQLNCPFHLIRQQQTHDNTNLQMEKISTGILTHS
jgi:hypothetical protein